MKKLAAFLSLSLFLATTYAATEKQSLDDYIHQKMQEYHVPGASVAIISDKKIAFAKAYGFANVATKRPMTIETQLQACSITKPFTSLAILLTLANQGISVDTNANNYLTSWKIPANNYTRQHPVTIRMLLDHSAGILNPFTHYSFNPNSPDPTLLQLLNGEKPATNPHIAATRVPGSKYEYCNGCYVILGALLQDLTHQSYATSVESLVLNPLNMQHSTFMISKLDHIAYPYQPNGKVYENVPFMQNDFIRKQNKFSADNAGIAVGGLWTTSHDLALFAIAIQDSLANKRGSYIPRDISEAMIKPSSTNTRSLGFFIGDKYANETKDGDYFMHGGFNQGYLAILIASKTSGKGTAIMINVSPDYHSKGDIHEWGFIKDVEHYIADQEHWI